MFPKLLKSIRANILTGFFLAIPIVTTIAIFNFLFKLATSWLPEALFPEIRDSWHGDMILRCITLAALVIAFYMVGLLTRNFFGRRLYQVGDRLLTRIPLIKSIYISVRQISQSLFTQRKTLFKEVVLVQYPRKGLYSLAFVTATAPLVVARHMSDGNQDSECVSLFISTTPNPTSGVFILVPRTEVIPLNMPVSDALTFIMSAGAVSPGEEGHASPTLLDKLEEWLRHGDNTPQEESHAET